MTLAVIALFAGAVSGEAAAREISVPMPNIRFTLGAHFAPKKLPKSQWAGVSVRIDTKVRTEDGSQPPALEELRLEFDRNLAIDAAGLPVCHPGPPEDGEISGTEESCKNALVGTGQAEFEIAFPEEMPFPTHSKVLAFNAGASGGKDKLLLLAYLASPVSADVVIPVEISKESKGAFGLKAVADVPKVAGGYGSVTSLSLGLHRKFTYKHKRQSYLLAKCPDGHLNAKGVGTFSGNIRLAGSLIRPCTPKG